LLFLLRDLSKISTCEVARPELGPEAGKIGRHAGQHQLGERPAEAVAVGAAIDLGARAIGRPLSWGVGVACRLPIKETSMKKLVVAVTLLAVAGYIVAALAADCPQGTKEECYGTANGKQNCVCR
jgi:hypothetical protein